MGITRGILRFEAFRKVLHNDLALIVYFKLAAYGLQVILGPFWLGGGECVCSLPSSGGLHVEDVCPLPSPSLLLCLLVCDWAHITEILLRKC